MAGPQDRVAVLVLGREKLLVRVRTFARNARRPALWLYHELERCHFGRRLTRHVLHGWRACSGG